MDAMRRGLAVLTTPVGQIQELIEDGVNGYFCRSAADFAGRLEHLGNDPDQLHAMRLASLETINTQRDPKALTQAAHQILLRAQERLP